MRQIFRYSDVTFRIMGFLEPVPWRSCGVIFSNRSVVSGSTNAGQVANGYSAVDHLSAVKVVEVRPVRKASSIRRDFLTRRNNLSVLPESRRSGRTNKMGGISQ